MRQLLPRLPQRLGGSFRAKVENSTPRVTIFKVQRRTFVIPEIDRQLELQRVNTMFCILRHDLGNWKARNFQGFATKVFAMTDQDKLPPEMEALAEMLNSTLNLVKLDQSVNRLKSRIVQISDARALQKIYQQLGKMRIREPDPPDVEQAYGVVANISFIFKEAGYTDPLFKVIEKFGAHIELVAARSDPGCEHGKMREYVVKLLQDLHWADQAYAVKFEKERAQKMVDFDRMEWEKMPYKDEEIDYPGVRVSTASVDRSSPFYPRHDYRQAS